ncbi:hypothetical protein AOLI_G00321260 [Acnodon oligacanthus]
MAARRAHADTRVLDHGRGREVGMGERLSIRSSFCLHGCSVALACALTLFGFTANVLQIGSSHDGSRRTLPRRSDKRQSAWIT